MQTRTFFLRKGNFFTSKMKFSMGDRYFQRKILLQLSFLLKKIILTYRHTADQL